MARGKHDAAALNDLGKTKTILPFNQAAKFAALDLSTRIASAELSPDNKETP